jgi:hypothetical protein
MNVFSGFCSGSGQFSDVAKDNDIYHPVETIWLPYSHLQMHVRHSIPLSPHSQCKPTTKSPKHIKFSRIFEACISISVARLTQRCSAFSSHLNAFRKFISMMNTNLPDAFGSSFTSNRNGNACIQFMCSHLD